MTGRIRPPAAFAPENGMGGGNKTPASALARDANKIPASTPVSPPVFSKEGIAATLAALSARIAAAAAPPFPDRRLGLARPPAEITLIAVSKGQPRERIEAALAAGHRVFGENRIQEAAAKWPPLRARFPDCSLHFIGPLQTNKAAEAVALFDVIHALDRPRLARALAAALGRRDGGAGPSFFLQVNTGDEPQKAGIAAADAPALLAECRALGLRVTGLMCLPPRGEDPAPHFAFLWRLARRLDLPHLSMGMSGDFETAAALGASHLRIGTAVFGPRPPREAPSKE